VWYVTNLPNYHVIESWVGKEVNHRHQGAHPLRVLVRNWDSGNPTAVFATVVNPRSTPDSG
jgi:hypothetical protein